MKSDHVRHRCWTGCMLVGLLWLTWMLFHCHWKERAPIRDLRLIRHSLKNTGNPVNCSTLDGTTEFMQMSTLWNMLVPSTETSGMSLDELSGHLLRNADIIDRYRTHTEHISVTCTISTPEIMTSANGSETYVKYLVQEYFTNGTATSGGATFTVSTNSSDFPDMDECTQCLSEDQPCMTSSGTNPEHLLSNCPYVDHFNGTYSFTCTLQLQLTSISVVLRNSLFNAYTMSTPINRVIFTATICLSSAIQSPGVTEFRLCESRGIASYTSKSPQITCTPYSKRRVQGCARSANGGHWIYRNAGGISWEENDNQLMMMSSDEVTKCMQQRFQNRIFVLGDSHMAYLFFYLLSLIDEHLVYDIADKVHHNLDISSYSFLWTTTVETIEPNLDLILEKMVSVPPKSTPLLIINVGSWDCAYDGPQMLIYKRQKLLQQLRRFKMNVLQSGFDLEIIWFTAPAYPDGVTDGEFWTNTATIGATNRYICDGLSLLSVPCIDSRIMTLTWQQVPVCGNHMLCARNGTMFGKAGKVTVHKLLRHICDNPVRRSVV